MTYGNLGDACYSLGQFHKAIGYHRTHLAIAIVVGDRAVKGRAYGNLGIAYYSLGQFHKAIEYHSKHLTIAIEVGDRAGECKTYSNHGNAYREAALLAPCARETHAASEG